MSCSRFVAVCLAVGFVASATAQSVPELKRYRVFSIPDEVARLGGYGPSASGEYMWSAQSTQRPAYWSPARGVDLSPYFPVGLVQVWDINNRGQCVGLLTSAGQLEVVFAFDTGFHTNRPPTFSVLPMPPGSLRFRRITDFQINDLEQVAIAGVYDDIHGTGDPLYRTVGSVFDIHSSWLASEWHRMPVPNDHWGADILQLNNLGTLLVGHGTLPIGVGPPAYALFRPGTARNQLPGAGAHGMAEDADEVFYNAPPTAWVAGAVYSILPQRPAPWGNDMSNRRQWASQAQRGTGSGQYARLCTLNPRPETPSAVWDTQIGALVDDPLLATLDYPRAFALGGGFVDYVVYDQAVNPAARFMLFLPEPGPTLALNVWGTFAGFGYQQALPTELEVRVGWPMELQVQGGQVGHPSAIFLADAGGMPLPGLPPLAVGVLNGRGELDIQFPAPTHILGFRTTLVAWSLDSRAAGGILASARRRVRFVQ